jgi:Ca2+-binding EF-hand superfamily protein
VRKPGDAARKAGAAGKRAASGKDSRGSTSKTSKTSRGASSEAAAPTRKRRKGKKQSPMQKFLNKMCGTKGRLEVSRRTEEVARAAFLNIKDLRKLREFFDNIDIDGSGQIDFEEFFDNVHERRTPFTDFIFTLIEDPLSEVQRLSPEEQEEIARETGAPSLRVSGALSFDDMVQSILHYCLFSKDDMLMFAFNCFDKDASGVIDENEFVDLCATVNNSNPTYPGNFVAALNDFDTNDDGMIDFSEFKLLNRRYQMVLFPIFRLQDALQKYTLGEKRWTQIAKEVQRQKAIEEYRRTHGGRAPPQSFGEKMGACFRPSNNLEGVSVKGGDGKKKRRKRKK